MLKTSTENRANERVGCAFVDLMGPMKVASSGGTKHAMSFVDKDTRVKWKRFLTKEERFNRGR